MGKTRDLFKKIRETKGTFHAKMGSIKDRNGMDLTEAKDIKKRWQEYSEELYKKDLHDPDNHDDVITNLEPDILECEVKFLRPVPPQRSPTNAASVAKSSAVIRSSSSIRGFTPERSLISAKSVGNLSDGVLTSPDIRGLTLWENWMSTPKAKML